MASSEIHADVVTEGRRVLAAAREAGLTVRLLGGVAVHVRSRGLPPSLSREYGDLDFASAKKSSGDLQKLMRDLGYEPHLGFNAMNGRERLLFYDNPNERQVDVFVSSFRMCHEIPLEKRLGVDEDTVPLAELLLTKLQIIELNEKDVRDTVAILLEHEVTDDDAGVNAAQFAALCCEDWGLCRTITQNLVSVARASRPIRGRPRRRGDAARHAPRTRRGDAEVALVEAAREDRRAQTLVSAARRGLDSAMRLYFATDIHGSETCWRKFLNAGTHYKADVLDPRRRHDRQGARPGHRRRRRQWHATLLEDRVETDERGRGRRVRGRRDPARLLPVPHDPATSSPSSRPTTSRLARPLPGEDARDGRALDARWPTSASAGSRHPRVLLPGQRRPVRGRRDHRRREARRARRGPRRRRRRLPDGVDRLGEPDAVGHVPRGGRGRPARSASRSVDRAGDERRTSGRSSASTARRTARAWTTRPS